MPGDSTFGQLSKILELYAPRVPPPILGQFVNNGYSRAITAKNWSTLRGVGAFAIDAPYSTGTITVTNGSATVTGSGTVWTSAAHAEKQMVISGLGPFVEVASVESNTSLTLTTPFVGTSGSGLSYTIQLIFLVFPTDFMHMTFIGDMGANWWPLRFDLQQEALDRYDPRRSFGAQPLHVVDTSPSPFTSTIGQIRYELWPRPTSVRNYFYRYQKRPALLSAPTDRILFPLRGDIIREGALMDLSMWPGTDDTPNPYYDQTGAAAKFHSDLFREGIALADTDDREMRPAAINYKDEYLSLFPLPGSDWFQTNYVPYAVP